MAVNGEESSTLLDYTRKWVDLVNRGGLFEIHYSSFVFFKEVEMQVHKKLLIAFDTNIVDQESLGEAIINPLLVTVIYSFSVSGYRN